MKKNEEKKVDMNETAEVFESNVFQMNPVDLKMKNRRAISEIVQDDVKQSRVQSRFFQSMKMQSLGTFAGALAHDFNNIFGTILASSSMLEMGKVSPDKNADDSKGYQRCGRARCRTCGTDVSVYRQDRYRVSSRFHVPDFMNDTLFQFRQMFPKNIRFQETIDQAYFHNQRRPGQDTSDAVQIFVSMPAMQCLKEALLLLE